MRSRNMTNFSQPRRFKQVDVFAQVPFSGNPLAVVLDADDLSDEQMQAIARWTNLSETTFVVTATDAAADYQVRIFSPAEEFPFAGHPTLGTAHALLEAGLIPRTPGCLVQQCGVGLVPVQIGADGTSAFRAPSAQFREFDEALRPLLQAALATTAFAPGRPPVAVDMGIRWLIVPMASAEACLAVRADTAGLSELVTRCGTDGVALFGHYQREGFVDYEVRGLFVEHGVLIEDPVTGSANACIARLLQTQGFPDGAATSEAYTVRQGTQLQRDGRLTVVFRDGDPWIGGHTVTVIDGVVYA